MILVILINRVHPVRKPVERKQRVEMETREARQAALIRLAKINMDQAIQIATSRTGNNDLATDYTDDHGSSRSL